VFCADGIKIACVDGFAPFFVGFFGMQFSSLFVWPFENDTVHRCLYIRSRHRLLQGSGYVILGHTGAPFSFEHELPVRKWSRLIPSSYRTLYSYGIQGRHNLILNVLSFVFG
jgi:hypothetical protein